jgi:hypothetical protein
MSGGLRGSFKSTSLPYHLIIGITSKVTRSPINHQTPIFEFLSFGFRNGMFVQTPAAHAWNSYLRWWRRRQPAATVSRLDDARLD